MDENDNFLPRTLCAEKAQNREWIRRGLKWLYENFDIGGVYVEFGEHAACYTPDCIVARKAQPGNESDFFKDLARIMPFVARAAHEIAPHAWFSYANYSGFTPEMLSNPPLHIRLVPDYAICQWSLTRFGMVDDLLPGRRSTPALSWPEGLRPPGKERS